MSEGAPSGKRSRRVEEILLVRLPYVIAGTLLFIAIAINLANIVARHLFGSAIFWAEEVLIYIVIWSSFISVAAIVYRGEHLNMDLFYARMQPGLRRTVNAGIAASFLVCSAIVIWQSHKVVLLYWHNGSVSIAAGVPMIIPHTALVVGFALVIAATLLRFRAYVSGRFE
jgi:TRAP-type C4-dicarboxylate transport system permease small subunit